MGLFTGFINLKENIESSKEYICPMTNVLKKYNDDKIRILFYKA